MYKSSLLIYVGLCSVKKTSHVCNVPDRNDTIHFYNYFMNAYVEIERDYTISTTSAFHRMIDMMDVDTFTHIISKMFVNGYCSHETILKILLMTHHMIMKEDIDKYDVLCKATEILHVPLKE